MAVTSAVLAGLLAAGAAGCSAPSAAPASARRAPDPPPSLAEQDAARAATLAYQRDMAAAGEAFVTDVGSIEQAVQAGDVRSARVAELAAQADYDSFRRRIASGSPTALALDGRPTEVPPGGTLSGLHLVERDLWQGGDATAAARALVAAGPIVEGLLSRIVLAPEAILTGAVDELGWVNAFAVPGREEAYSRLDSVDVAAGVAAADAAFVAVTPLARMLAPEQTLTVAGSFTALDRAVAALGRPGTVPDASIPAAAWLAVARQVDATAAALAGLGAQLVVHATSRGYGTEGVSS